MRVKLDAEAIETAIHRELQRQYPGVSMEEQAVWRIKEAAAQVAMYGPWMHIPQSSAAQDRIPGWEAA